MHTLNSFLYRHLTTFLQKSSQQWSDMVLKEQRACWLFLMNSSCSLLTVSLGSKLENDYSNLNLRASWFSYFFKGEIQELVLGMPHRGRLNLLTDSLKFPAAQMFSKVRTRLKAQWWIRLSIYVQNYQNIDTYWRLTSRPYTRVNTVNFLLKKNSKMLCFLFVALRWKETQNFLKELKALEMFCLIWVSS